jgi:cyclopropane fatty-acyl-phospholipid synthase-like methyltransferase
MKAEWFELWFDTPYYHILYKSRGDEEAQKLIDNLEKHLGFNKDWLFCDMACGKGRHSVYLNSKGYDVIGLDLSPNNVWHAQQSENNRLQFFEHDIREVFRKNEFDVMLNLFTSFGYFEEQLENQEAVVAMAKNIKPGGTMVIDYMNSRKAIEDFNTHYEKKVNDILFNIDKKIEKGFIFKKISFSDKGEDFSFEERVKLLFLDDFEIFFKAAGLELVNVYGNYQLELYDEHQSDRMVMVCKKTHLGVNISK